ncbi:uncharacterized protein PAC_12981 [Phialocephala subalpina]|uniref:Uncharacterized protein n=1 Tax=Phialocephala subalpina TaxID=576137 RepID=A0A1L7XDI1_9HELO|nr:uncharacterized protein PAC_12981 [Phialocephala subalpina]
MNNALTSYYDVDLPSNLLRQSPSLTGSTSTWTLGAISPVSAETKTTSRHNLPLSSTKLASNLTTATAMLSAGCAKIPAFFDNTPRPHDTYQITHKLVLLFDKEGRRARIHLGGNHIYDVPRWQMEETAETDYFPGSIVVMGVDHMMDTRVTQYRDVTPDDLRVSLTCFLEDTCMFEDSHLVDPRDPEPEDEKKWIIFGQPDFFKAVEIGNEKDVALGDPKLQESAVTERMGITLLARKCPTYKKTPEDHKNPEANALFLNVRTTTHNKRWGRIPSRSYENPTFLVFRKDKEDVTKQQVEALSAYCREVVARVLRGEEDWAWEKEDKEAVFDFWCSVEKFGEYFETFKLQKLAGGHKDWRDATLPSGMRSSGIIEVASETGTKRLRVLPPPADIKMKQAKRGAEEGLRM